LNWEPLLARRLQQRLNFAKKFMQRVPCLRELLHVHVQLLENKEYESMKQDRTSLLRSCKKEWHRMRAFFKKHPFKNLDVDDSSIFCQDVYCAHFAKVYALRREQCVNRLKNSDPMTVEYYGKKFPFSVCPLADKE
jgi:hypothetical protein